MAKKKNKTISKSVQPLMNFRVRLLPLVLVSALFLLGIKVEHIARIFLDVVYTANTVYAAEKKEEAKPAKKEKKKGGKFDKSTDEGFQSGEFDILSLTPERVKVLNELSDRNKVLDAREGSIKEQEAVLLAIEKRLEKKSAELKQSQEHLKNLLGEKEEKDKKSLRRLVQMYEKMKPGQAAEILQGIDLETLLEIVENMKEAKASLILANMDPQRARVVTMQLAQRRKDMDVENPDPEEDEG
ncbi:MAG: MotE family protein [Alphaproteobacteria bacterium]